MKVILTTDVPKVGNKYDVKEFKDGFARNVLIAKGLAKLATPSALAELDEKKKLIQLHKKGELESFNDLVEKIKNKKIEIKVKCNDKGHLFKAVNSKDVVSYIKEELGESIDENDLEKINIKKLGKHNIKIKKGENEASFHINIVAI